GFAGNEAVAMYRIKVGRQIGSAALVADGVHARTDGFTSLAVVLGVAGVWLGFPLADPIIGLLISAAIAVLLWGTARDIGRRLMDGVDPELVHRAECVVTAVTPGQSGVRLRWMGHKLHVEVSLHCDDSTLVPQMRERGGAVEQALRSALPNVGSVTTIPVWTATDEPTLA
uniref:cation diffusion facilitator family transporter n=1 Tax=Arthrobacter sp. TaxID=1667 RepID=UPI003A8E2561